MKKLLFVFTCLFLFAGCDEVVDNYPYDSYDFDSYDSGYEQLVDDYDYDLYKRTYDSGLSNDNYYINVDGYTIHAPAYSDTVPAGASAKCNDGTYSFSEHRSGTCSGHKGVAQWL